MFSEAVISVKEIGKAYQMYANPHDRLKQFLLPRAQRLFRRPAKSYYKEFWALKGVSFELRPGETVGVIGRNGSGKSTLLQLVCGTLTPSVGQVSVRGRVAALLELGSGFNPEFTGRENVYLNAAVFGLSRKEIDDRFKSIIEFADIGDFIEHPVKTYSSGMMVRLAFAVIVHVDADVLIIDEALAVGDAIFTQKCMRWLRSFQTRGSILFVSHDTSSVRALCNRAIWLHEGVCRQAGDAKEVTEAYLRFTFQEIAGESVSLAPLQNDVNQDDEGKSTIDYGAEVSVQPNIANARGWETGSAEVLLVTMENASAPGRAHFEGGENVRVRIRARAHQPIEKPILGFLLRDRLGQDLFGENTLSFTDNTPVSVAAGGEVEATFCFRLPMLPNGNYELMASIADGDLYNHVQHHWLHDALMIVVSSSKVRYGLVGLVFQQVDMRLIDEH